MVLYLGSLEVWAIASHSLIINPVQLMSQCRRWTTLVSCGFSCATNSAAETLSCKPTKVSIVTSLFLVSFAVSRTVSVCRIATATAWQCLIRNGANGRIVCGDFGNGVWGTGIWTRMILDFFTRQLLLFSTTPTGLA